jgi:cyclopropane fatty-acyl-phospholipid synthase-like methyltransferase
LRSLAATNLIISEGDRFANSAVANQFLVRGRPQYMGGSHELYFDMFSSVLATTQSVRTGAPQALHDWDQMPDDQLRAVLRGLNPGAAAQGRTLAHTHDFSRFKTILDVGGGGGGFAIGACEACPNLTAQVVELPRVARISEQLVASAGLASRVRAVSHDMTAMPSAQPYDAAVLRNLLQVLAADRAQRVLENVARSLKPGGEIFIGAILDDDGLGPTGVLAVNLFFLNAFHDGEAYTESEYREWLETAGFVDIKKSLLRGGLDLSLLTARRRA